MVPQLKYCFAQDRIEMKRVGNDNAATQTGGFDLNLEISGIRIIILQTRKFFFLTPVG